MRKFLLAIAIAMLSLGTASPAYTHGGGLDWQGGHNCRVGSCAGTYHCHQARGGVCAPDKKITITCAKGNLTKKVTAANPVCPTGYKKKQ
jgi:hypothetical protein